MFVDLMGVGKDCSELWGGYDGQDTSGALKYICGIFHELFKCFTCINSFSKLINDLVNQLTCLTFVLNLRPEKETLNKEHKLLEKKKFFSLFSHLRLKKEVFFIILPPQIKFVSIISFRDNPPAFCPLVHLQFKMWEVIESPAFLFLVFKKCKEHEISCGDRL